MKVAAKLLASDHYSEVLDRDCHGILALTYLWTFAIINFRR